MLVEGKGHFTRVVHNYPKRSLKLFMNPGATPLSVFHFFLWSSLQPLYLPTLNHGKLLFFIP